MGSLSTILTQSTSMFVNFFTHPDWRNIVDVLLVTMVVYQIIKMINRTRANSVMKGVGFILLFTWLTEILQFNTMNWLLTQVINTGAVLLVILFQPEIRRGLEQIGRSRWRNLMPWLMKERASVEETIKEIVDSLTNLSRRKVGALVVFERDTGLSDIVNSGTLIDAIIAAPLIENIFEPNTPLHDGAMVIRGDRIVAAACILQLSDDHSISRELGTRHRAALGVSETTDALTLIVSEETGIISMARGGKLTRYLDANSLTAVLMELYSPPDEPFIETLIKRRKEKADER